MRESILISMVIIFIYIFLFFNRKKLIYIESNSGNKLLLHDDKQKKEKGQLLTEIVTNMYKLKFHLTLNINTFEPEFKRYIKQLDENLNENTTSIYETDPTSDLTSYSVNKGEELSFCLRSKKNNELHSINLLMYVAIHEMSHIACPEIGHGTTFKIIFKRFAEEAVKIGIYNKIDYSENPVEYCGMILSSSII
jgi:predicted metal-dependent hydrolase